MDNKAEVEVETDDDVSAFVETDAFAIADVGLDSAIGVVGDAE
jgi:hypothetical protein